MGVLPLVVKHATLSRVVIALFNFDVTIVGTSNGKGGFCPFALAGSFSKLTLETLGLPGSIMLMVFICFYVERGWRSLVKSPTVSQSTISLFRSSTPRLRKSWVQKIGSDLRKFRFSIQRSFIKRSHPSFQGHRRPVSETLLERMGDPAVDT